MLDGPAIICSRLPCLYRVLLDPLFSCSHTPCENERSPVSHCLVRVGDLARETHSKYSGGLLIARYQDHHLDLPTVLLDHVQGAHAISKSPVKDLPGPLLSNLLSPGQQPKGSNEKSFTFVTQTAAAMQPGCRRKSNRVLFVIYG